MAEDWERELDRQKTDPDYQDRFREGLDKQAAAARAWDQHYTRRSVVALDSLNFKPHARVKWLDKDNKRCEGTVIGGVAVDAFPSIDYVVLADDNKVVEVDEISLMHGWELPDPAPTADEPPGVDIPF